MIIKNNSFEGIDRKPPACLRGDDMPSKPAILFLRVEAGTGLVGEAPVTIDFRIGILFFERGH